MPLLCSQIVAEKQMNGGTTGHQESPEAVEITANKRHYRAFHGSALVFLRHYFRSGEDLGQPLVDSMALLPAGNKINGLAV